MVFSPANGDWNNGANWQTNGVTVNAVPGQFATAPDNDLGIVNLGRISNITTATPPTANPYAITVGNGSEGATLNLSANVTNVTFIRLANNGANADGDVLQTAGAVGAETLVIGQPGSAGTPAYEISGGSLYLLKTIIIEDSGTFILRGDTASVSVGSGSGLDDLYVNGTGRLKLMLGTLGLNPIDVGTDAISISANARLVVDGSNYEGLDGYFPLVLAGAVNGGFAASNVTFIGFGEREPALVQEADGLWLRVIAPTAFSDQLCSLVPASTIAGSYGGSTFAATRTLDLSGSAWTPTFNEAHVMDTRLSQTVGGIDGFWYSWDMRLGRGGHVYSFRPSAIGETVPPSYRDDTNSSPWNDEVWQCIAVDTTLNNPPNDPYFIHQSGPYFKNPDQTEPFYSPQVAACLDVTNRSFTTINWGQHAQVEIFEDGTTNNDWKSHVLYFTRYKDLGQGVIEASTGIYNYGPDLPDYLNMPWGGVRRSSTEYAFLSKPGGTTWTGPLTGNFGSPITNFNNTGGWIAFSNATNNAAPALGVVYGSDAGTLLPQQSQASRVRWGYAGALVATNEAAWRNYFVMSTIRRYGLTQGNGVWSRYYFVLGQNLQDVSDKIAARSLVDAQLSAFSYTEASTPVVGYRVTGSGGSFGVAEEGVAPDFYLYAHPVTKSFPIYEIIKDDHSRHLTWDPFATGVVKPYDGTIAGMRLLGFALRTADINSGTNSFAYESFTSIMSGPLTNNYLAAGESLSVRLPETTYATLTSAGTNYPVGRVVVGAAVNDQGAVFRRVVTGSPAAQEPGQGFTLTQPTTLTELTLFFRGSVNATTATNNLVQLWIGAYPFGTGSGGAPGATYVDELIDMTGIVTTPNTYYTIDFTDTEFPAGNYAFQLAWQTHDDSHTTSLGNSTNDVYAGGGRHYLQDKALPLPASATVVADDLVFALQGTTAVIKRDLQFSPPQYNLVASQTNGAVGGLPVRYDSSVTQYSGQVFTLTNAITLSALTLKAAASYPGPGTSTWDTNSEHRIKLWIGAYTNSPGATHVEAFIDLAGDRLIADHHHSFDFTDTVLPPGSYAFQLGWTTFGSNHTAVFKRSDGSTGDEYPGGDRLFAGSYTDLPFNGGAGSANEDAVFALHDASFATVTETGATFPADNVVAGNAVGGTQAATRYFTGNSQYFGQSFTLTNETTLDAVTFQANVAANGTRVLGGGVQHQLDVWIGSYTNGTPFIQTTHLLDTLDVANFTFTQGNFYRIDISDITLPAGRYAFEMTWRQADPTHQLIWHKSTASAYPDGGWLFVNQDNRAFIVPFATGEQPSDLVFAVHEAAAVVTPPTLSISEAGGMVMVEWNPVVGTLQLASVITGPWSNVSSVSPYLTSATNSAEYYRVIQTP
jgi:hypothetical protein